MRKPQNYKLITVAVLGLVSQTLLAFSLQQNNILFNVSGVHGFVCFTVILLLIMFNLIFRHWYSYYNQRNGDPNISSHTRDEGRLGL